MHLSHALELGELCKDDPDGGLHLLVRVLLDSVAPGLHVADGYSKEQRATTRLLFQRLVRALPKQRKLELAHRAFHAEQQAIVGMPSMVDPVLVDDDSPDQSAELDQRMPVAAVAGEPGGFDRKYGPDAPVADRRQQSLEAGARDAASRAAEIVINNLDGSPAELFCATGKAVLAPQALLVVHKLIGGRLAHVDEGAAGEVVRRDLGHRRPPCPSAPSRSRAAAPRSTPPTAPAERESALFGARPLRTDLAVERSRCASCLASSIPESDRRKRRSASASARRARRASRESLGSIESLCCAADSCVIQAGIQATVPSG